jgi:hypothetical protein
VTDGHNSEGVLDHEHGYPQGYNSLEMICWPLRRKQLRDSTYRGVALGLTSTERAEFAQAKARGYVITKVTRHDLQKQWVRWCEAAEHPCIVVRLKTDHADVILDLVAQPYRLSKGAVDTLVGLKDLPIWRGSGPGSTLHNAEIIESDTLIRFLGVDLQHTDQVAQAMLSEALAAKAQNEGVAAGTNKTS